ncbi:MAG: diheme cytochrome c [Arcobacter sp.]|nr:diheme cytochrome c [Arcobacter sp.]
MKKTIFILASMLIIANADDFKMPKTTNATYQKECKSCHMAFQPTLLNSSAWEKMMDNLKQHFGTDASLEPTDTKIIKEYLMKNSNEKTKNPSNEIAITKLPWFAREHRKISKEMISNDKIKTLSNCMACHQGAQKGNYDEDGIKIPGQKRFHD